MKNIGQTLVIFVAAVLGTLLVVSQFSESEKASVDRRSATGDLSSISLATRPALAAAPEVLVPQDAHAERLAVENLVRESGPASYASIARSLVDAWSARNRITAELGAGTGPALSRVECFFKGCILTFSYGSADEYHAFNTSQQHDADGLVAVWPGSKYSSGVDMTSTPVTSSWVLYFDDDIPWTQLP